MKEIPILFNAEMVRAILSGRKTQTRRTINPRHRGQIEILSSYDKETGICTRISVCESLYLSENDDEPIEMHWLKVPCQEGDTLYVRETFAPAGNWNKERKAEFAYKADYCDEVLAFPVNKGLWHPSIHMPRAAARLFLPVVEVRVERLQDISEEDAIAEGIWLDPAVIPDRYTLLGMPHWPTAKEAYAALWDSVYGKDPAKCWSANPWVWVVKFTKREAGK